MIRAVFWIFTVGFVTGGSIGYYLPKAVGLCIAGIVVGGIIMELGAMIRGIEKGEWP